jgi:hypothetical protein
MRAVPPLWAVSVARTHAVVVAHSGDSRRRGMRTKDPDWGPVSCEALAIFSLTACMCLLTAAGRQLVTASVMPGDPQAPLAGHVGVPHRVLGVGADAARGALAEIGPDPPAGQPTVGIDGEAHQLVAVGVGGG